MTFKVSFYSQWRLSLQSSPFILRQCFLDMETETKCESQLQQTTNFAISFLIYEKNRYNISADDSHDISCLICFVCKSSKIWNCRLLQIIGGVLWVKVAGYRYRIQNTMDECPFVSKFVSDFKNCILWCLNLAIFVCIAKRAKLKYQPN